MTTKKMESINVRFDPFNNKYSVWFCYDDGSSKDGAVFNMDEEGSSYDFHVYVRDVQDHHCCYNVLFYQGITTTIPLGMTLDMKLEEQLEEIIFQLNNLNENVINFAKMSIESCPGYYRPDSVHCFVCEFKSNCKYECELDNEKK